MRPNNLSKDKILIISPGIEDNGMRGLGFVTIALLQGLSLSKKEVYLLTGAPIRGTGAKNNLVNSIVLRRYLDHYLVSGYKSSAFQLTQFKIIKHISRDLMRLFLLKKTTVIPSNYIVEVKHSQSGLKRFSGISGFANYAFIYRIARVLPNSITTTIILLIAKKIGANAIITASPFALSKALFPIRNKPKIIQYAHDVMPLHVMETPTDSPAKFAVELEKALAGADLVMASSRNAKFKLKNIFPKINSRVVYLPCERPIVRKLSNKFNIISTLGIKQNDYLLFMSALEERKNVVRLIKAYSVLYNKKAPKLVLVGSAGYGWPAIEQELNSLAPVIRRKIILTGYISEEEKWSLIDGCLAVVHPAIDEGLGLPVIEAIVAAKPVAATRLPSIEEISPPGCIEYIEDPYDVYEIANRISIIIKNTKSYKTSLVNGSEILKERFSMARFSQRLDSVLNKL